MVPPSTAEQRSQTEQKWHNEPSSFYAIMSHLKKSLLYLHTFCQKTKLARFSLLYSMSPTRQILKNINNFIIYKNRIMNIKPLADRVLILPMAAEEKTVGGIIIPDTAKEKPLQGKVVAVGNGTKEEEMVIAVGDQVLYGKYSGTELEFEGEKYLIMRQSDVLAILG